MSSPLPGFNFFSLDPIDHERIEHVVPQRELDYILAFAGWTIDELEINPLARRDAARWYRLSRAIDRRLEILELDRQWDPAR